MSVVTKAEEVTEPERPVASVTPARPNSRAYREAHRHSTRVRWLRRTIPIGAVLAMTAVAGLALFNPFKPLKAGVTLGPVSVSGTKVVMENPRLTGFRKDSQGYEVTAAAAMQDVRKPTIIELKSMKGRVAVDDKGRQAHLEAASGVFDTQKEQLELDHDVHVWTEEGQDARLKSASVDFKAGTVASREPVIVTVPNGTVEADALEIGDKGKVISFIGRVRTVLQKPEPGARDGASDGAVRSATAETVALPEVAR